MANYDPNLPVQSIFESLGYNMKQIESWVVRMNPQYDRPVLAKILDYFQDAVRIKSKQRLFTIARQANAYPAYTITSRAVNGANLVLTLNSGGVAPRLGVSGLVTDENGVLGKIASVSNNQITISLSYNPNGDTTFGSSDFVLNTRLSDRGNVGNTANRNAPLYQLEVPDPYYNIIGQIDEDVQLTHDDFNSRTWLDNSNGTNLYALQKEIQALQRFRQWEAARCYSDIGAVFDGNEPIGATVLNQVKTMGGQVNPLTDAVDETFLINLLRTAKKTGSFRGQELLIIAGGQAMIDVGYSLSRYVVTAGDNNVVGGKEVKGIDIKMYAVPGLTVKLIEEPLWANPLMFPALNQTYTDMSGSMLLLDTSPALTEEGQSVPFMLEYYYGSKADIVTWQTPGLYDRFGNTQTNGLGKKDCVVHFTWDKQYQLTNPGGAIWCPRT